MRLQVAIRKRIKSLMKTNNLNGNQLSLKAGISRSSINKFLRSETKALKIETIGLICEALNITLKEFFDDEIFIDIEIDN